MLTKLFALALITGSAVAQARPSTYKLSCNQAARLVQKYGAIPMNYAYSPSAGNLYNRYVANSSYCVGGEVATPATVPTTDNADCFIGYTCETVNR